MINSKDKFLRFRFLSLPRLLGNTTHSGTATYQKFRISIHAEVIQYLSIFVTCLFVKVSPPIQQSFILLREYSLDLESIFRAKAHMHHFLGEVYLSSFKGFRYDIRLA